MCVDFLFLNVVPIFVQLLRTILRKKIFSSRTSSTKRYIDDKLYLEDKHAVEKEIIEEEEETKEKSRASDAVKWDKTDSDCKLFKLFLFLFFYFSNNHAKLRILL